MKTLVMALTQKFNFTKLQSSIQTIQLIYENNIKNKINSKVMIVIKLSLFTILLAAISSITVHNPLLPNILINIIIPLSFLLLGFAEGFALIKLGTLVLGRIAIVVSVLGFVPGDVGAIIILWLLRINILEATAKDFIEKHYYNFFSGIIVFGSSWLIDIQWVNNSYPLIFPSMIILWALAYTVWNLNFVYMNFNRSIFLYHIGILTAPLLYCITFLAPSFWLIMRATTLTLAGTGQIIFEDKINSAFKNISKSKKFDIIENSKIQFIITSVVLILIIATVYFTL